MKYAEAIKEFLRWLILAIGTGVVGYILIHWTGADWQWCCVLTYVGIGAHAAVMLHDRWVKRRFADELRAMNRAYEAPESKKW